MRLWVKDADRRPDPPQVQTDDRLPVLVGTVIWVLVLVVLSVVALLTDGVPGVLFVTAICGIAFGIAGLIWVSRQGVLSRSRTGKKG